MKKSVVAAIFFVGLACVARAETPEEWVRLGARVHGAFGSFIPVGIRIGLDALDKLKADPRGLTVIYYNGEKPPCPCVADGVMLATMASPGQGTFQIAAEKAPAGTMAVIVIRNRKTGQGLRYEISDEWLPKISRMEQGIRAGRPFGSCDESGWAVSGRTGAIGR